MPVILHVDPASDDRDAIRVGFSNQEGWTVESAASYEEAVDRLNLHPVDAVLAEADLGDGEWRDLLTVIRGRQWNTPVFVVTNALSIESAAQTTRDGAELVFSKGSDVSEWLFPLECAIERAASRATRQAVENSLAEQSLQFVIDNDKGRVPHLVTLLVEHCDRFGLLDDRDRMRIQVALEEALLNAVIHGNLEVSSRLREMEGDLFEQAISERRQLEPYRSRRVTLIAEYTRESARFTIRDQGPGFDVEKVRNPTEDDAIELASGRGILLMRSFMDSIEYNDQGNEVRMVKRRSSSLTPQAVQQAAACGASIP